LPSNEKGLEKRTSILRHFLEVLEGKMKRKAFSPTPLLPDPPIRVRGLGFRTLRKRFPSPCRENEREEEEEEVADDALLV
jgi:hypothetical protein